MVKIGERPGAISRRVSLIRGVSSWMRIYKQLVVLETGLGLTSSELSRQSGQLVKLGLVTTANVAIFGHCETRQSQKTVLL